MRDRKVVQIKGLEKKSKGFGHRSFGLQVQSQEIKAIDFTPGGGEAFLATSRARSKSDPD